MKRALDRRELTWRREPFDRFDFRAIRLGHRHQARFHKLAIHEYGAGAAFSGSAAFLRPGQVEVVTQRGEQALRRLDIDPVRPPVDLDLDRHEAVLSFAALPPLKPHHHRHTMPWYHAGARAQPGSARVPRA